MRRGKQSVLVAAAGRDVHVVEVALLARLDELRGVAFPDTLRFVAELRVAQGEAPHVTGAVDHVHSDYASDSFHDGQHVLEVDAGR